MRVKIFICLLCISCSKQELNKESIQKLITSVQQNNNMYLNQLREDNKVYKKVKINKDSTIVNNLQAIDKLLKLNNDKSPNYRNLSEYIVENNLKQSEDCKLKIEKWKLSNDIEYYILLDKIIKETCLSPGTLDIPRSYMNYTIAGQSFNGKLGETLKIPVKAFPQKLPEVFKYIFFDTIDFKALNEFEGYYSIETGNMEKGTKNIRKNLYAKDVYSNKTEKVGIIEFKLELNALSG
jgi:hypothetical protein